LLYKTDTYKFSTTIMHLIILALLFSCQFDPVYRSGNYSNKLCSIRVADESKSAKLYEIDFKNELISILCTENKEPPKYVLEWSITKNFRQLLQSESTNNVKRYEETLVINFSIYDNENKSIIFSDTVRSIGAYNILEDEFISTFASKATIESQIAVIAAKLTLDKIHLFMLKNENSKF